MSSINYCSEVATIIRRGQYAMLSVMCDTGYELSWTARHRSSRFGCKKRARFVHFHVNSIWDILCFRTL